MFDWLKRPRSPAHPKSGTGNPEGENPKTETADDALQKAYRQAALKFLLDEHGLDPVYRPDILSEEDYNTRVIDMPLISIWNQRPTDDGVSFSISVNPFLIWCAFREYMNEQDPTFDEECSRLLGDLKHATHRSMQSTISQTGALPSEICAQLAQR